MSLTVPVGGSCSYISRVLKATIITVGRDKDRWISDGVAHYVKLLSRWCSVDIQTVSPKTAASLSPVEIKRIEAEALKPRIDFRTTVALSDSGKTMDTPQFAVWLEHVQSTGGGQVRFVIGGPYGLDDSILRGASEVLSLSPLTFSHQLVRLVLLEQLYRGFSILHGTDYHK